MDDEHECPSCGETLSRGEDEKGVTYQCHAMDCMQFFDEAEIEIEAAAEDFVSAAVLIRTKKVELVEDIYGTTEHGDEVTIPAGQILTIAE